ncbi:hypothetical protein [Haloglomus litoreum]|uniref:hypothetical protein n=1 Tax=Haloglomus litoreum TaxID=3034026 RepID=UPI0023E8CC86|nr:hypothetical protein [Haloglomus sp. DT116]
MRSNENAVTHRDLPPKVSERAAAEQQSPVRHEDWLQRLLGRARPRHDLRTLADRLGNEARRLREGAARLGRRLTT